MSIAKQKVGAIVLDKKGRILASAFNDEKKSHPTQAFYAKKASSPLRIYLHAEIAALVRCRKNPYKIIIARISKKGELGLARPCAACMLAIEESGIREIVYSSKEGWWKCTLS